MFNENGSFKTSETLPFTRDTADSQNMMLTFECENKLEGTAIGLSKILKTIYQNNTSNLVNENVIDLMNVHDAADRYMFEEFLTVLQCVQKLWSGSEIWSFLRFLE